MESGGKGGGGGLRGGRFVCRWRVLGVALVAVVLQPVVRAELSVATYNVQNYVAADRRVDGVYRTEYPKPESEKEALRSVIRSMNADVLALQEMGPAPYLKELQRDLATEGADYRYAELLEAADKDRHIAVLSRRPFLRVRKHADLSFDYFGQPQPVKRGMLEVVIRDGDLDLTIFVLHLKSRFTDRSDDPMSLFRRTKEAAAARERILSIFPEPETARFLVVGDFNDGPRSKPLARLTKRGDLRIASILPARDSRGHTWTHFFAREETYSRVDYVLVSPGLATGVRDGAAEIVDLPEGQAASDHRPVLVRLVLGSAPLLGE